MANPTTNFGWVMPTSASLVTNLPANLDTALQGTDTSLLTYSRIATVTATAAGTTTLTVSSNRGQTFTGSTTQTVLMPVTSTLKLGDSFEIMNASSGVVTVQSSGANSILAMAASTRAVFTCVAITGTTAASWTVATAVTAAGSTVIQTVTTSGSATTVSFTSIPSTYRNLRIVWAAQSSPGNVYLQMRFNTDTAANYDFQSTQGSGTTMTVGESFAQTALRVGRDGGTVGGGNIVIPNYKDTTFNKVAVSNAYAKDGTSTGNMFYMGIGGTWRNTAAITQIDLTHNGGETIVNNSVFTLYGES